MEGEAGLTGSVWSRDVHRTPDKPFDFCNNTASNLAPQVTLFLQDIEQQKFVSPFFNPSKEIQPLVFSLVAICGLVTPNRVQGSNLRLQLLLDVRELFMSTFVPHHRARGGRQ